MAGLSQAQLERRASLPTGLVSKYETGERFPRRNNLEAILDALGATVMDLAIAMGAEAKLMRAEVEPPVVPAAMTPEAVRSIVREEIEGPGQGRIFGAGEARRLVEDLAERAEIGSALAGYFKARRDFAAAEAALTRATADATAAACPALLAQLLAQAADLGLLTGDLAAGLDAARRALAMTRLHNDPRVAVAAAHNALLIMVAGAADTASDAERAELVGEARRLVALAAPLYDALGAPSVRLRRDWAWARLLSVVGESLEAERVLRGVVDGFAVAELYANQAVAILDLVLVLLDQGKAAEVERLAVAACAELAGKGVDREALAALALAAGVGGQRRAAQAVAQAARSVTAFQWDRSRARCRRHPRAVPAAASK